MNLNEIVITFDGLESTGCLREHVRKSFESAIRWSSERVVSLRVTLSFHPHEKGSDKKMASSKVAVSAHLKSGEHVSMEASGKGMYSCVSELASKFERHLSETRQGRRRNNEEVVSRHDVWSETMPAAMFVAMPA